MSIGLMDATGGKDAHDFAAREGQAPNTARGSGTYLYVRWGWWAAGLAALGVARVGLSTRASVWKFPATQTFI